MWDELDLSTSHMGRHLSGQIDHSFIFASETSTLFEV